MFSFIGIATTFFHLFLRSKSASPIRIGYINKNCRGKLRCIFCSRDAHDSASPCSSKNKNPSCINCQGGHLAISHDCPMIIKHKMVLSLAATENIPLVEAKRKILQGTTAPKDMVYDYNNFPLLNISNQNRSSNNNYHSHNQAFNIPQFNRFSAFNLLNNSEDPSGSSPAHSPPSNNFYINNKPLFSQMIIHPHEKVNIRSQKPSQRCDYDFNSHNQLLYLPNGRSLITPNNGVGYSNQPPNDRRNENPNSFPSNYQDPEKHDNAAYNNLVNNNDINNSNINIVSLNNAILSLTKNIELINSLVRSAYLSSNASPACSNQSNVNNK